MVVSVTVAAARVAVVVSYTGGAARAAMSHIRVLRIRRTGIRTSRLPRRVCTRCTTCQPGGGLLGWAGLI